MKKLSLTFLLILLPNIILAAENSATSTIARIYPHTDSPNGDFIVTLHNDNESPCPGGYYRVTQGESRITAESMKKMFSAALTAAAMQKQVRLQYNILEPNCFVESLWVDF